MVHCELSEGRESAHVRIFDAHEPTVEEMGNDLRQPEQQLYAESAETRRRLTRDGGVLGAS